MLLDKIQISDLRILGKSGYWGNQGSWSYPSNGYVPHDSFSMISVRSTSKHFGGATCL